MLAMSVAEAGERAVSTVTLAGFAAGMASYMFGMGLAEQEVLREKADRLRGRQRMAEVASVRAARAARLPVPDPDIAIRRRIAEREGALIPPGPRSRS